MDIVIASLSLSFSRKGTNSNSRFWCLALLHHVIQHDMFRVTQHTSRGKNNKKQYKKNEQENTKTKFKQDANSAPTSSVFPSPIMRCSNSIIGITRITRITRTNNGGRERTFVSSHMAPSSTTKVTKLTTVVVSPSHTSHDTSGVPTGVCAVIPVATTPKRVPRIPAHHPPSRNCHRNQTYSARGRW